MWARVAPHIVQRCCVSICRPLLVVAHRSRYPRPQLSVQGSAINRRCSLQLSLLSTRALSDLTVSSLQHSRRLCHSGRSGVVDIDEMDDIDRLLLLDDNLQASPTDASADATAHEMHKHELSTSYGATTARAETIGTAAGMGGWSFDDVDPATGKTKLDVLYDTHLEHIHRILEQPLPPMPRDGNVDPDFFIGFAHYNYRLRDRYRAVLARELDLPVKALRLSVAWSGRFNVTHFKRSQKVCGVDISREGIDLESGNEMMTTAKDKDPLPEDLQQRILTLINAVNARNCEHLLNAQMVQASSAIPEVEFALTKKEHRLLTRLQGWLRTNVLQSSLVVVIYGGNRAYQHTGDEKDAAWDGRLRLDAEETTSQHHYICAKWLKSFQSRQVVPHVLSLSSLAGMLAAAILHGAIEGVQASGENCVALQGGACVGESNPSLLSRPLQLFLNGRMREVLVNHSDQDTNVKNVGDGPRHHSPSPPVDASLIYETALTWSMDDQQQLLEWMQMVRQALLLHMRGGSSAQAGGTSLPALFVHGGYAGGAEDVRYLQHNKAAMDALLLHPNDIAFKKSFASRLRGGQTRLRLHEELQASHRPGG